MIGHGGNVRGHRGERIDEAGAVLDKQARNRVAVVTGPRLRHVIQHPGIESASAAGAAFEEHIGKFGSQFFQNIVESQDVPVQGLALARRLPAG